MPPDKLDPLERIAGQVMGMAASNYEKALKEYEKLKLSKQQHENEEALKPPPPNPVGDWVKEKFEQLKREHPVEYQRYHKYLSPELLISILYGEKDFKKAITILEKHLEIAEQEKKEEEDYSVLIDNMLGGLP